MYAVKVIVRRAVLRETSTVRLAKQPGKFHVLQFTPVFRQAC